MASKIVPNQFELRGKGVRVDYSTSSITGQAQLSFQKGRTTLQFSGDQIGLLDSSIGTLVTVTVAAKPDRTQTLFSFLLPAIQLAKQSARQSFRTVGLSTTVKTTIAGPPKGVQHTYRSVPLRGSARQVQSVAAKTAGA
ncbi:MAG: hypothetical protein IT158_12550 [Bryobacterales bacterium]|nr:hypothetical protein [Bryobacterales bacterium]